MEEPLIQINDFKGGMTLNEKLGRPDQFHIGSQIDFFSYPGKLTVGKGWEIRKYGAEADWPTKLEWVTLYNGDPYWGGADGKIYNLSGLAHDTGDTNGMRGMAEYQGNLYYAVGYYDVGKYDGSSWTDNWQDGALEFADYHTMYVSLNGKLYIANGQYVASYDGTTFKARDLDLPDGWKVVSLADFGELYLAIGATYKRGSYPYRCAIFLWDRSSPSYNAFIEIPENQMRAMLFQSGWLWIWAGETSNIYVMREGSREAVKIFSFSKEKIAPGLIVYPSAVCAWKGTVYFGLSDVISTAVTTYSYHPQFPTGIYSFPVDPNRFSINIPYKSPREKNEQIYSLLVARRRVWAFYYFHDGVDYHYYLYRERSEEDNQNPYWEHGTYESFTYDAPPGYKFVTDEFWVEFDPLPSTAAISLYVKTEDGWQTLKENFQTDGATYFRVGKKIEAEYIKLKLTISGGLSSDPTSRPLIKRISVLGHYVRKI